MKRHLYVRPPEENAGPMTWGYAQYEIKVFPFAFNPSFMVEDVIPEIDSNDSFGTNTQHVDHAQHPMDSNSDRTSSRHAEFPLGAGRSSADILIPPPPPPGNSGISFDALAAEQEDLRDARESLLGFRFRLRSKRRELKLAREKAGSKAGEALTLTRRYLQEQGIEFTDEMIAVFSEVDTLRDELGIQEVNYEEVEAEFDSEEWKYTQQEEDVIETLIYFSLA
ncbi:hypothetical protein E8E13_003718 [Curvularia kusanoi]|uniref:Uncharacterized protein n=1 Tax=Curvularia kusanoi TaxID=90978 RepID=A0A9P4W3A9_CURKU|nr:hypothetical protein E8E13_003718 [Curvularia kusanoi]